MNDGLRARRLGHDVLAARGRQDCRPQLHAPIDADDSTFVRALTDTLHLARRYGVSAYDASYLELALRSGLPLATLDVDLAKAASKAGVARFSRH